eukprot:scaffold4391_cov229-Prasinococcus_capsulatus_cf.AAC.1
MRRFTCRHRDGAAPSHQSGIVRNAFARSVPPTAKWHPSHEQISTPTAHVDPGLVGWVRWRVTMRRTGAMHATPPSGGSPSTARRGAARSDAGAGQP